MAVLVLVLGVLCLLQSLKSLDIYLQFPHLIRLDWGGGLLIAPLIYLYVKFMCGQAEGIKGKDLWCFFPYITNVIIISPFLIKDGESKIQVLDYYTATLSAGTDQYTLYYRLLVIFTALIGVSYCKDSLKVLKVYQTNIKAEFSALTKKEMLWLKYLIWAFMGLFVILAGVYFLYSKDRYASFDYEIYFYLVAFVLIYAITYSALNQPQVDLLKPSGAKPSTKKSSNQQDYAPIKTKLIDLMKSEKPYLKSELTATQLAEMLDISRHQFSLLLSESFEMNFYDLINQYRVNEFKERVESSNFEHLTLLAIAYDAGFNSKTAFNTAFKRIEGVTPSQYKKNIDLNSAE